MLLSPSPRHASQTGPSGFCSLWAVNNLTTYTAICYTSPLYLILASQKVKAQQTESPNDR